MSRLKHEFHFKFNLFQPFLDVWKNTPYLDLEGWERIATNQGVSTYAMLFSLWQVWNHQFQDPTITNGLYIEWLFRDTKLWWPLGTIEIPMATLGQAKVGLAILYITEQNAIT